ncbi:aminotransferase class III-fold pyridoxal phosphate-dependent enzyme [Saccharopolyspora spinosa]|uniref:Aminotransferase class III n=1 Tax=Saccharopolyspora spinosa TaxID=60894 RepID=A0A2N3XWJ9_SACSN|nr:aminotransferase class III-fold pyridoxal phosphate-dependent enzyme [Saccharopolyspora spinosa]PKW15045.1 aminotransferase class III [Saccharopolyspora spinosa]
MTSIVTPLTGRHALGREALLHEPRGGDPDKLTLVRALGSPVWEEHGCEYIDCTAQAWSNNLGAGHSRLIEAVIEQTRAIAHARPTFHTPALPALCDELDIMLITLAAVQPILDDDLPAVAAHGRYATERLREMQTRHPLIGEVRSSGLMVTIELVRDRATKEPAVTEAHEVFLRAQEKGLIFSESRYANLGSLIKIKPPFDIPQALLSRAPGRARRNAHRSRGRDEGKMSKPITTRPLSDADDLATLGYRQRLRRPMSPFMAFALAFSMVSINTGIVTLFTDPYKYLGGSAVFRWLPVLLLVVTLVAVYARLAGRMPITGYAYQWSSRLVGPSFGWCTGWIALISVLAGTAGTATAIGTVFAPKVRADPTPRQVQVLSIGCTMVVVILNVVGVRVATRINNVGASIELIGTVVVGVVLIAGLLVFFGHTGPPVLTDTRALSGETVSLTGFSPAASYRSPPILWSSFKS